MSDALPASVFKAYDIRGTVPTQLNDFFAHRLGLALAALARQENVRSLVVGHDGRLSSPGLSTALQAGLHAGGIDTVDVGLVHTPLVYFATHLDGSGSGVAITGSHNPPDYNGFKMMMAGRTLHGADIQALHQRMNDIQPPTGIQPGQSQSRNLVDTYISRITDHIQLARPMHIAIDCGNGVGAVAASRLFQALGCTVDELYCTVDGHFPNHHPDPAEPKNLQDLIHHLQRTDCEIGLAFDGDADRLGVVTKSGQIIWPDRQLVLFARDILQRVPGASIIFDVKCSRHLSQAIRDAGGKPLMSQTGHSLIKARLADTGAPLAGEMSGHLFFKERWYGFDDGLYAGARLLEILSRSDDPGQLLEALPQGISTPELKLPMAEGEPHAFVARLQAEGQFPGALERITIDGIRAEYADGFGLARASNTTPVVVLRFEGDTPAALDRIQAEFRAAISALLPGRELPF
ncbi:phosphomannomutase/phosphoglucomutase [Castellaniella sp.]|uniref:phosphomannomutase/phosphoglucomutase n=1 Tax=Castellaniella sp. TaxID=1955812 RepID=UPI002AFF7C66|nr:phosphomannomutase/phosphoglucomutase [Castellaniella sp.]